MKTITLIGMMGSGKSTIGKLLADKIKAGFVDVDYEIVQNTQMSISDIFSKYGEKYFRELEANTIKSVFQEEGLVISLGGGAFENVETRNYLMEFSNVIYLKTSSDVIFERIKMDKSRPLLKDNMNIETINYIINEREKNYELAKFIISTDNKEPEQIVDEILGVL